MKSPILNIRTRRDERIANGTIREQLQAMVAGQPEAVAAVADALQLYEAGLLPDGRPVGVFLLLGPTGTGKTHTVEALAAALHGSRKSIMRIDCGEFQLDHEVAKLIGAPPGYLGHRETNPLLTQAKINAVSSEHSPLTLVLFDEIEKAAPSLTRLLLGVLDRATLRLGDNTTVDFSRSLIFFTSNLGASEMSKAVTRQFGFAHSLSAAETPKLRRIAMAAVKKRFSPEFVNRIDHILTYATLDQSALQQVLDLELTGLQYLIDLRYQSSAFDLRVTRDARLRLLEMGVSREFGARNLRRLLHREILQPLARMVLRGQVEPGGTVEVRIESGAIALTAKRRMLQAG